LLVCLLAAVASGQETDGRAEEGIPRSWLLPAERAWLAGQPVIRHGVLRDHEPFEFADEQQTANGLTSDYMKIIEQRLGVHFEPVIVEDFAELSREMQLGNIDIASYLPPSSVWTDVFVYSEPVIRMPIAVFGRQDADLVFDVEALDQWRVAVEHPSRAFEIFSRDWPELELARVESTVGGLQAVSRGDVDYFIHNVFSVEYFQRKHGLDPLRIALMTPYSFDIRISARQELAPIIPLVHKVLDSLSEHERTLIFDKWVNLRGEPEFDWGRAVAIGSTVFGVVLLGLLTILYWNRRLTREVAARTLDLEESRETLRALALHLDQIREEEKSRLALEIHDELGHTLTALAMSARRFARQVKAAGDEEGLKTVEELRRLTREATATSRRIMSDLRPSMLEDLGLLAAIEWLAQEFEAHYAIPCTVSAGDDLPELPNDASIALFRIAQESLTNIAKHAGASHAEIELTIDSRSMRLRVCDDGQGIPDGWQSREGSFGLLGISERALALGGEMNVSNRKSGGACVEVRIPVT
jgi:signal transduction histidine kinase